MSIFEKWIWIKRNWTYILEEAMELDLVFVGGTSLNLVLFNEYRASEDIDLYDPHAKDIGTSHEKECVDKLAKRLRKKGFEIKSITERSFLIGPNIKVEVFNDGTSFEKIEKRAIEQIDIHTFDLNTHANMKMKALLCRSIYDARDLIDLFIIKKQSKISPSFPNEECEIIKNSFNERIEEIKKTKREDLLIFQTEAQIDELPYKDFEEYSRWLYDWLSGFR